MSRRPRVLTIPASTPFLPTLAAALLDGKLIPDFSPREAPLALASATVYLPTRRAAGAFGEALLEALGTEAALLPRIVPLGEVDEDALAFAESSPISERPSPISPTARRLVLAQLVLKFAQSTGENGRPLVAATPAASLLLADELARLFDDITIAGVAFDALNDDGFVPAGFDQFWQQSLEFLQIARVAWDAHLKERALVDPLEWRDRLLAREAARLAAGGGPVIAAGSTGTIPAVAKLIETIARRENGAVVLPGLDQTLDDATFDLIEGGTLGDTEIEPSPGHPQFGLKRLIGRLGIVRGDIETLGEPASRERFLSEAFRPAATTDRWRERGNDFDKNATRALAEMALIEAADPREEALALAIALRETLETGGAGAALVTPDRALARRVAAELRRWQIEVDDSAGVALADTEAGRLARLAASVAAERFAPIPLLALLRHPFVRLGVATAAIDCLEIAALRGPRPAPGPDGLLRTIEDARERANKGELHRRDARAQLSQIQWEQAADLAVKIVRALEPLWRLVDAGNTDFALIVQAHGDTLARLGLDVTAREPADIRALGKALDEFVVAGKDAPPLGLADYADAFEQLLAGEPPVRPPFDRRARVRILGPLEARLIDCGCVLLGGLNEGVWPPETHVDAWLNRPMRRQLGLDLPERRTGLSAHDFVQAIGGRAVVLSRARKQNGVETVASRFLQRLHAVAPHAAWMETRQRGERFLTLARELERPSEPTPVRRPAPTPPAEARPDRLSVTEIETLIRDPYSIYARHVLSLDPIDEIDADPGTAERGTVMHDALAQFAGAFPHQLPADALEQVLAHGRRAFAVLSDFPGLTAVWWPRFERVARWLVGVEMDRRKEIDRIFAETNGAIDIEAGGRPFRLTARADRIEWRRDGSIAIIDYKTGEPPTLKQALIGLAPQLPLEAAIAKAGGFKDVPGSARIDDILVFKLSGGDPPGRLVSHDPGKASGDARKIADARGIATADDLAEYARRHVSRLIAAFADARAPYQSIPRPKWRGRFGQYDHLARIKEWSAGGEETE
jgi:ATP-dependent helicase/nuclease subunit B